MSGLAQLLSTISPGVQMRQGTVTNYNGGSIDVTINDTLLTSIPYLDSYIPVVGDTVMLLQAGATWLTIGRAGTGTPQLAPVAQSIATKESTTSSTYTDLSTFGPSATIIVPATGRAIAHFSAEVGWADGTTDSADGGFMSIALSGANTVAAVDDFRAGAFNQFGGTNFNDGEYEVGRSYAFTGLTPGSTTFTMKYRSAGSGKSVDFGRRTIVVEPA